MKKNGLLKVILIVLGSLILVSGVLTILGYFVPGLEGKFSLIPLGDILPNYVQTFAVPFDIITYFFILGAFYSVLNEVAAYKKLIENIVTKFKSHSKLLLVIITILFAVVTAVSGQLWVLFVFIPFAAAIILGLGYDKLVVVSSTVVSMLVGFMSSIYVTFRNPNNPYYYSLTNFEGLYDSNMYVNLWPKLAILVLGTLLLIFFILRYIKNVQNKKLKYDLNESNEIEVSEVALDYKKIRTWPLLVVLLVMLILLIVGYIPWNSLFGIECFDKFNTWLLNIKIGDFAIFNNVVSNYVASFGNWVIAFQNMYMPIDITLVVFMLIIKFMYNVKFDDILDNFVAGIKKVIPTVFVILFSYVILICAYNNGFVQTIISLISDFVGINEVTTAIVSALGTLLHSDMFYTIEGILLPIMQNISDESMYSTCVLTFQTIYGLVSMIAPTSLFVVFAVKYFDIPYTSYVKYIWRFILMLFLLVLLVLLVIILLSLLNVVI